MNTNDKTEEALGKLMPLINGNDYYLQTKEFVRAFISLADALKTIREENKSTSSDSLKRIETLCNDIIVTHKNIESKSELSKAKSEEVLSQFTKTISSIRKEFSNFKASIKDGEDGKDADEAKIIEEVLNKIKLPKYKEVVLDDGNQIIEKINKADSKYQIDWIKIKNIPKSFSQGQTFIAGNRFLDQLVDVDVSGLSRDSMGRYILGSGGGGGSQDLQSVTDIGNTTTNSIEVRGITSNLGIKLFKNTDGDNEYLRFDDIMVSLLRGTNVTSQRIWELPDESGAFVLSVNGSFASTSGDIALDIGVTSVTGTTNRITSTGGATPVIDISASYVGQSSITTLGTITTGVWQGTAVANGFITSTFTSKTIDASLNTISNLTTAMFATNVVDTDATFAANSDTRLASQKATKSYVDNLLTGLTWKTAVRVATTANGTLATAFENGDTIDGVTLATGDRILIKNQSTATQNGIYIVAASGAPTRSTDADTGAELVNATVFVSEGTTNADTQWTCTNNTTITIGSTNIVFAQVSGAGTYSAGNGLTLTGNQFTIDTTITADLSTAQTFTNKTLTSPKINENVALTTTATKLNYLTSATGTTGTTSGNIVFDTTPTFVTNITAPKIIGGTGTTSTLTLQTTSGVGTTNADMIFLVGNNGGTEALRISNAGALTTSFNISCNNLLASTLVRCGATSAFNWNGRSNMKSSADGLIELTDTAGTSFGRLNFGGSTSSFPSIKRNTTALNLRLADDSADCDLTLGKLTTSSTIELGNTSDTTLSRSSAGVLAVEGVVIPSISSTNTLTNKRVTRRVVNTTQSATPTINTDNTDVSHITALAQAITSMTTNLSGTPVAGDTLWINITDNGTARAITWGASFAASTVALPTTTVISTRLDVGFVWDEVATVWRCIAVA